ncbi:hypothetical protein ElyMa_001939700 [Elysia marginata]|uniref:Uncharacterized protein n=1 Tax=Elysia marginata TaxID=1093978 RepID=A0AAV4EX27_9GAST|nr:hypothetical protein ElyMa_001939700 [Elysia marginata]
MTLLLPWRIDVIITCVLAYMTPSFVFAFQTQSWNGMTSDRLNQRLLEGEAESRLLGKSKLVLTAVTVTTNVCSFVLNGVDLNLNKVT